MNNPVASVIIIAYNEEKYIQACLESLQKQQTTIQYEVVLVDNASTDNTASIAKKHGARVVSEKRKGRGFARQKGVESAKGAYLLFTEADTIVPTDWVERMVDFLKSKKHVAVTGPMKVVELSWMKRWILNTMQPISMHAYRLFTGYYILAGFNFALKKKFCLEVGGFDTNLMTFDDLEFSERASKHVPVTFIGDLVVTASARRFKKSFLRGMYDYMSTQFAYVLGRPMKFDDPR